MADPHFLYLVLALDAVGLVAWVLYVLVRMPPARPVHLAAAPSEVTSSGAKPVEGAAADSARPKLPSHSDIQDDPADSPSE